jgi:hypothetical protein
MVWFNIMNTINMSTNFTPFQLHFGKSPHILPPILDLPKDKIESTANKFITQMQPIQMEAQDNLPLHLFVGRFVGSGQ